VVAGGVGDANHMSPDGRSSGLGAAGASPDVLVVAGVGAGMCGVGGVLCYETSCSEAFQNFGERNP